jgi:CheY-like chemotaxis protein
MPYQPEGENSRFRWVAGIGLGGPWVMVGKFSTPHEKSLVARRLSAIKPARWMATRLLPLPMLAPDRFQQRHRRLSKRTTCLAMKRPHPLHAANQVVNMCEPSSPEPPPGTFKIVVVDDEASVRRFVVRTLTLAGYEVITFRGPLDALQFLERDSQRVDLLLTDVVMPEMSGRELAQRVHALRPTAAVLLMSGFDAQAAGAGVAAADRPLLPKPFTPLQLTQAVARVLERK